MGEDGEGVDAEPPARRHKASSGGQPHHSVGECKDQLKPHIKLQGQESACPDLLGYCQEYEFVKRRCCASCTAEALTEGVSNQRQCRDREHPDITDREGNPLSCRESRHLCRMHAFV